MPDADVTETEPTTETDDSTTEPDDTTPADGTAHDGHKAEDDTFPRKVVEDLRRESAGYRDRAKTAEVRADELARKLHTAIVAATCKLADATDLAFDAEHLDDTDKLAAAIDELTASKPHLKSRKPFGDVGQGVTGSSSEDVDLLGLLRQRA